MISRKSPATRDDDAFGAEIWFKGARDHDNASYVFLRRFSIVSIQNDRAAKNHNRVGGTVIHTDTFVEAVQGRHLLYIVTAQVLVLVLVNINIDFHLSIYNPCTNGTSRRVFKLLRAVSAKPIRFTFQCKAH